VLDVLFLILLSNPKHPAVKKCAALKKAIVMKSKVAAKKWLDGRLMEKF